MTQVYRTVRCEGAVGGADGEEINTGSVVGVPDDLAAGYDRLAVGEESVRSLNAAAYVAAAVDKGIADLIALGPDNGQFAVADLYQERISNGLAVAVAGEPFV